MTEGSQFVSDIMETGSRMDKLAAPFGEIRILTDGRPVPFAAQEGSGKGAVCPHLLGRSDRYIFCSRRKET